MAINGGPLKKYCSSSGVPNDSFTEEVAEETFKKGWGVSGAQTWKIPSEEESLDLKGGKNQNYSAHSSDWVKSL